MAWRLQIDVLNRWILNSIALVRQANKNDLIIIAHLQAQENTSWMINIKVFIILGSGHMKDWSGLVGSAFTSQNVLVEKKLVLSPVYIVTNGTLRNAS